MGLISALTLWVPGQPGLHSETVSSKQDWTGVSVNAYPGTSVLLLFCFHLLWPSERQTRYHPSCVTGIKFFLLTALCSGLPWWCNQERRLLTFTVGLRLLGLPVTCLKGKIGLCLHFSTEIFINMTFLFLQNLVGLYTFVTPKSFHLLFIQLSRHNILLPTTASTATLQNVWLKISFSYFSDH